MAVMMQGRERCEERKGKREKMRRKGGQIGNDSTFTPAEAAASMIFCLSSAVNRLSYSRKLRCAKFV
jgi:hypothetical protein